MPYQKVSDSIVIVALDRNALDGTPLGQSELLKNTACRIVDLIQLGRNVIVTHGNGPQLDMINNAFAFSGAHDAKTPAMPLPEAGAMSQGYIGYQLSQAILNEIRRRGIMRSVANVITQTVVDAGDEAFMNPLKPFGPFLSQQEAEAKSIESELVFKEDAGGGLRHVVAGRKPLRIVELDAICDLVSNGYVVVCGGGVPVIQQSDGTYKGAFAVVDKDCFSAQLANDIGANVLLFLTAVERVAVNCGEKNRFDMGKMSAAQAREYIGKGQFSEGNMLPKIEACVEFVEGNPRRKAIIASLNQVRGVFDGGAGTTIVA